MQSTMKGAITMANLNQMELENLRHFIGAHSTIANKLDS